MQETDLHIADEEGLNATYRNVTLRVDDISSYVPYSALKSTLGKPQDDFFEMEMWGWHIRVFDGYLRVEGNEVDWSVIVYHEDEQTARKIGNEFIEFIRKQSNKYLPKLKNLADKASVFIIQNPYAIYRHNAVNLLARAKAIKEDPTRPRKAREVRADYCRSAFFLFVTSFEGLLNLIYWLYMKPALRDPKRITPRLEREQIDLKVRLLPVYCLCFSIDAIDHQSEAFKRFQYITDALRNDFIHANLTEWMRTPVVIEDEYEFVVRNESEGKYGLPRSIVELDISQVEFVKQSIEDMVNLVIDAMKPPYKYQFRPIIDQEEIYCEVVDNEYIIQPPD